MTKRAWLWELFKTNCKKIVKQFLKKVSPKQTNYVLLQGGLGNQLYMLSYAFSLKMYGFPNIKMLAFSQKNKENSLFNRKFY